MLMARDICVKEFLTGKGERCLKKIFPFASQAEKPLQSKSVYSEESSIAFSEAYYDVS